MINLNLITDTIQKEKSRIEYMLILIVPRVGKLITENYNIDEIEALKNYADTLLPCVYDDFIGTAKEVLTLKHCESLRKLLDFRFKKNPRYNLSDKKLKMIEKQIQMRAKILLEN